MFDFASFDSSKSHIKTLYGTSQDVLDKKPSLSIFDKTISFGDLQQNILDSEPFIKDCPKNVLIDCGSITENDYTKARSSLESITKSPRNVVIQVVPVKSYPEVTFMHAELKMMKDKKPRYFAPRFAVDLRERASEIKPNHGVCINLGCIVTMPKNCKGRNIVDNKIVTTAISSQPEFIIVPVIVSSHEGITPTLYARDAADSGVLTINFTTASKFDLSKKLLIVLYAFTVGQSKTAVSLVDVEAQACALFKPKDSRRGRSVKNPKVKFYAQSFDTETVPNSLILSTFDNSKKPIVAFDKQKIKVSGVNVLFSSRKREWHNTDLVSLSGLYNATDAKLNVAPKLAIGSQFNNNTHCMTLIDSKVSVYSEPGKLQNDFKIINGSFINHLEYMSIKKNIARLVNAIEQLSIGAKMSVNLSKQQQQQSAKLPSLDDAIAEFDVKGDSSSEEHGKTKSYSYIILKSFILLVSKFCRNIFTPEQLQQLDNETLKFSASTSNAAAAAATTTTPIGMKRKHDDDDDDDDAKEDNVGGGSSNNNSSSNNNENESKRIKLD